MNAPALSSRRSRTRAAELELSFEVDANARTFVAHQRATHPFHIGRALYRPLDPPGLCTLYSQGCSGGLFENDRLAQRFVAGPRARARVTTAASTIVHRMPRGGHAEQSADIEAASGSFFECVPEPLILFPASRLRTRLAIRLEPGARVVALEAVLQHRLPDDERPFESLQTELSIEDFAGKRLARERSVVQGSVWRAGTPGLAGAYACYATVLALGAGPAPLSPLRAALDAQDGIYAGATLLPGQIGVLARVLASDAVALRSAIDASQAAIRGAFELPPPGARPR